MSSASWRKNTAVIEKLSQKPAQFPFLQAVRLLERASVFNQNHNKKNSASKPVALFSPPSQEAVRFSGNNQLIFHATEISDIQRQSDQKNLTQWKISVNFMGLTGSQGVLPYHYTEMIQKRLKVKDTSLSDFLDLFNHRTISLFYQASSKYRLPLEYERKKLNPPSNRDRDDHSQILMSLIGLGTRNLEQRMHIRDESLFYYSGLLSQQVRTTAGLRQILRGYFGIPVEIREFVGQWQELIDDVRTRLPGKLVPQGQNNCLGKTTLLGKKGWYAQGKISIVLGPVNKEQLHRFAPNTTTLKILNEIVKIYAGMELQYDFVIKVKRSDIPQNIQLGSGTNIIGWNTWLSSRDKITEFDNDTVEIKVSSSQLT